MVKTLAIASPGDLPVFQSQALRYKARHECMYLCSQHLRVSRVWREVVPGFPWLANLVKRASFWLNEDLSDGSKVDNKEDKSLRSLCTGRHVCASVCARTHTYTYTQRERERDTSM